MSNRAAAEMNTLNGLKILVTGGAVRVGRALALGLAEAGCDIAVHYSSSKAEAEEIVRQITVQGRRSFLIQGDFRRGEAPAEVIAAVNREWGALDVLINSASVYPSPDVLEGRESLLSEELADWELSLNVNARAPFFLIKHATPLLQQSRNGNVVNILDTSAVEPYLNRASHTVSKSALATITRIAAGTLAPQVRVNALLLGGILPPEEMPEEERKRNIWLGTEDVVAATKFLLSTPGINNETIGIRGSGHFRVRAGNNTGLDR